MKKDKDSLMSFSPEIHVAPTLLIFCKDLKIWLFHQALG